MSRVKNPFGLNIIVCGTNKYKSVPIKNVVYLEILDSHSQIEPMENIYEICSLLNETFPTNAKRESVLLALMGKGKSLNS